MEHFLNTRLADLTVGNLLGLLLIYVTIKVLIWIHTDEESNDD